MLLDGKRAVHRFRHHSPLGGKGVGCRRDNPWAMKRPVRTRMSYPRQQQQLWARKATLYQVAGTALLIAGFIAVGTGRAVIAVAAFPVGCALITAYTSAANRAARHRIGADSEQLVHDTLERLRPHGYTITHGARWPGGGDIDHLVRTPHGLGLCIETKTRAFDQAHLERLRRQADWAAGRLAYPRDVLPIMCMTREHNRQLLADGVLIVSPDTLLDAILVADAAA
jgi:Nuclease-related domain